MLISRDMLAHNLLSRNCMRVMRFVMPGNVINKLKNVALAPVRLMAMVLFMCTAILALAIMLATNQPSVGFSLGVEGDEQVVITNVTDKSSDLSVGQTVASIKDVYGHELLVTYHAFLEEPDILPSREEMLYAFFQSGLLFEALEIGPLQLALETSGNEQEWIQVFATESRPIGTLPVDFWLQTGAGFFAVLIGSWVWSLRPKQQSTISLLLSGFGLQISATTAATYSTREIALSEKVFFALHVTNLFGTLLFGFGLVSLFLTFPKVLKLAKEGASFSFFLIMVLLPAALMIGGLHIFYQAIVVIFLVILLLIIVQYLYSRHNIVDRRSLGLLGLGALIGSGSFVITRALPTLFGAPGFVSQGESFVLITLVYLAVAISVQRYHVFDLPIWSARLLYYFCGALLLVSLDALLIWGLSFDRMSALSVSLLTVTLFYLPLREWFQAKLTGRAFRKTNAFLGFADFVARSHDAQEMQVRWKEVLANIYRPLGFSYVPNTDNISKAKIVRHGEGIQIPFIRDHTICVEMVWASNGARLFDSQDRKSLDQLRDMVLELLKGQAAHSIGVHQERSRIARDLHDNLSVGLLTALHSHSVGRKDELIRTALTDMRRIINANSTGRTLLSEYVGSLRGETFDLLDSLHVTTDWPLSDTLGVEVSSKACETLRAILRECLSNALEHADTKKVSIDMHVSDDVLFLNIINDNTEEISTKTIQDDREQRGHGLENIQYRVNSLGGEVTFEKTTEGQFKVLAALPLKDISHGR